MIKDERELEKLEMIVKKDKFYNKTIELTFSRVYYGIIVRFKIEELPFVALELLKIYEERKTELEK